MPKTTRDYLGLWVTEDHNIRQALLPNGRYIEARGHLEAAYQGNYQIVGNHIEYQDDTGFVADGDFIRRRAAPRRDGDVRGRLRPAL